MTTKYDIGDVVMIPATVKKVMIYPDKTICYELAKVANNSLVDFVTVSEKDIIDTLAVYGKRNDRTLTRELINKKVSLIKELREANGFSANEISMIMNMDECAVIRILQAKEDE